MPRLRTSPLVSLIRATTGSFAGLSVWMSARLGCALQCAVEGEGLYPGRAALLCGQPRRAVQTRRIPALHLHINCLIKHRQGPPTPTHTTHCRSSVCQRYCQHPTRFNTATLLKHRSTSPPPLPLIL